MILNKKVLSLVDNEDSIRCFIALFSLFRVVASAATAPHATATATANQAAGQFPIHSNPSVVDSTLASSVGSDDDIFLKRPSLLCTATRCFRRRNYIM